MNNTDYAGIEVSKNELCVGLKREGKIVTKTFKNNRAGLRQIKSFLCGKSRVTKVVMEWTGVYCIESAMELVGTDGIDLMLANPRSTRDFARALLKRGKNDKVDTLVLIEYAEKVRFRPYIPPDESHLRLRSLAREITKLTRDCTMMKNRLHATTRDCTASKLVAKHLRKLISENEKAAEDLQIACMELIRNESDLSEKFDLILTVKGIGIKSGIQILAELCCIPRELDKRQVTAMAGLDPVEHKSGTSLNKRKGISRQGNKNLRRALYFPALSASRSNENVRAFYKKLTGKGKLKMVALVAVMRKLLHSVWVMLQLNEPFDSDKFYRIPNRAV